MLYYRDLGDKKFVEEFYNEGKIMISNLYRYKNLENQLRKDNSEGIKSYVAIINPEKVEHTLNVHGIQHYNEKNEILNDLTQYRKIEMANCYAMSFSFKPTSIETSIVINDIQKFEKLIADELHEKHGLGESIMSPCQYYESKEESDLQIHILEQEIFNTIYFNPQLSFFLKNKIYQHEKEFRIVWIPLNNGKSSIKIFTQTRKNGYKEHVQIQYYPEYFKEFPNEEEMISNEPIFIYSKELISCALPR
jgi:hypothetical protein